MSELEIQLRHYFVELEASGWTSRARVATGASSEEIDELARYLDGWTSAAVTGWFGLVNGLTPGQSTLGKLWMFPLFVPMSIPDAVEAYQGLLEAGVWDPSWFPFLEDQAGWFYAIDMSDHSGRVVFAQLDIGLTPVVYASVTDMVRTHRLGVEQGLIWFDGNGVMVSDEDGLARLSATVNPSIAWWS